MKKRMFTPDFFTDEELVEGLDIPGRLFYLGTWSVAEDSGVIPMSPLSLKMKVFPGDDVSPEKLQEYIDILVSMKKIIPFEHGSKQYGWVKNFHRHQTLDNPSKPTLPLPHWVTWIEGETRKKSRYFVDESLLEQHILIACPGRVPDKTGTCPAELKELKEGKEVAEASNKDDLITNDMLPHSEHDLTLEGYCQEIQNQLIVLGANPNYIAKADEYTVIKQFFEAGIPIDFIKRVIVSLNNREVAKGKKGPRSFSYCQDAIEEEWQKELIKNSDVPRLTFHKFVSATNESTSFNVPQGVPRSVRIKMERHLQNGVSEGAT